jgi:acyl-CoA thioesterase-2
MQEALDRLVALLDLEELEVNIFRGRSPQEDRQRVFGGQVAGQALVSAGRTVDQGVLHSLHAYFLRPGDPTIPILYDVDRIRDGRSFTTRRVVAIQHGRAIFNMSVSFHTPEGGLEHQVPMPDCPPPEALPSFGERAGPVLADPRARELPDLKSWLERDRPIDMRFVDPVDFFEPEKSVPRELVWLRADGSLPDDLLLHQCVLTYASDMTLLDTALRPHGIAWSNGTLMSASLDHAMWFHRAFRADEWLLYVQESPAAAGARGFASARVYTREGVVVASVAQEGLIRRIEERR